MAQQLRQWKAQWQRDGDNGNGNGRRNGNSKGNSGDGLHNSKGDEQSYGDVTATTAMAMEGAMATMTATVVMAGVTATAMEGATAT